MPQEDRYMYVTGVIISEAYITDDGKKRPRSGSDYATTIRDDRRNTYTCYSDKGVIQLVDYARGIVFGQTRVRAMIKVDRGVLWNKIYTLAELKIVN